MAKKVFNFVQDFLLPILVAVAGVYMTWASAKIISNSESIAVLTEKNKTMKEYIVEIKADVKYIRKRIEQIK